MILGEGGNGFCCRGSFGGLYGESRNLLKTGCMGFQFLGSLSSYAPAPTFALTSNGPYHLLLSVRDDFYKTLSRLLWSSCSKSHRINHRKQYNNNKRYLRR